MSRLTVCHITTVHPASDNRILEKECVSLAGAGYDMVLLAPNAEEKVYKGVRIKSLNIPRNRLMRMTVGGVTVLREAIRQKARVFHFHDPELMPVGLLLRLLGREVIADVHENYPASMLSKPYLGKFSAKALSRFLAIVEVSMLKGMSAVVTATPEISRRFRSMNPVTVQNYPVIPDFATIPKAIIDTEKDAVIYTGGLSRIRGIIELINAFEYLDHAELWLLGRFESDSFRQECESLPAWKNVRYLGAVDPTQVYSYLKAARIGIATLLPVPNYLGSLATKSFEYMAAGLPVIMSDFPYWREIFGEAAFYVDPTDSGKIAEALNTLLGDEPLMKMMAARSLEKSKGFNWQTEANKLISLYDSISSQL